MMSRAPASRFRIQLTISGVLAVTRSLGDASMKEFVVGAPYTTETTLDEQDEFLVVACDGVSDEATKQPPYPMIQGAIAFDLSSFSERCDTDFL